MARQAWGLVYVMCMLLAVSCATMGEGGGRGAQPQGTAEGVGAAGGSGYHEDAQDTLWDEGAVVDIALDENGITVEDGGAAVDGSQATIGAAGTYRLRGSLSDGQIVVDTDDEGVVQLILDGVTLGSATSAPLYVRNAAKTIVILADGSENFLSDAEAYIFTGADENEPNATIFSNDDLTLLGDGSLTVEGRYNDGISSDDGLIVNGANITVRAVDDGIRGKDYLVIKQATVVVEAHGDGLKSDLEDDATQGTVSVAGGRVEVTAGGDAVQAAGEVLISGGEITLTAGGGSKAVARDGSSARGIRAGTDVHIAGGNLTVDAAEDAVHAGGALLVEEGTLLLACGDDAMHADGALRVNGGTIRITASYEGIEGAAITINGGEIQITASGDGLNVAGGNDGSGTEGGPGQEPDSFAAGEENVLWINGGAITIEAGEDGIDANGSMAMTGGAVVVHGPTAPTDGAIDYDDAFRMSGGFLVAGGSAEEAQAPDASSTQQALLLTLDAAQEAGTLVHIQSDEGEAVLTFAPKKAFRSIAFSSGDLREGETYVVYLGGSAEGVEEDGLYAGGAYMPGVEVARFVVSEMVTSIGEMAPP